MDVTVWKGSTYGIRVGKENTYEHFPKNTKIVLIDIDGYFYEFRLSKTFWTTCPEFQGKEIGKWLIKNGLDSWQKSHPPKLKLLSLGKNRFKLTR